MSFKFDADSLLNGLDRFSDKMDFAVWDLADKGSKKMENYAKQNARWENRTGHARQRLKSDVLPVANGYKIRLAHGVDYGKWLELAHEKKYAIIPQTIRVVGTEQIMPAFTNLMDKAGRT